MEHSGKRGLPHCKDHPPIREMLYLEIAAAMEAHLGFTVSRHVLAYTCRRLSIERRQEKGPRPLSNENRASSQYERWKRWAAKLSPDRKEQLASRQREYHRRWRSRQSA